MLVVLEKAVVLEHFSPGPPSENDNLSRTLLEVMSWLKMTTL